MNMLQTKIGLDEKTEETRFIYNLNNKRVN